MTEAWCHDCLEMFIVTPDTETLSDGTPEHEKCEGYNTEVTGVWSE